MKNRGLIAALLVAGGIALGFVFGRASMDLDHGGTAAGSDGPSGKSGSHLESGGSGRGGDRMNGGNAGRSPAAVMRQVVRKLELSPMAGMDYDALFDAYESIRWMNPEEARIALDELEAATSNSQIEMVLQMMIR